MSTELLFQYRSDKKHVGEEVDQPTGGRGRRGAGRVNPSPPGPQEAQGPQGHSQREGELKMDKSTLIYIHFIWICTILHMSFMVYKESKVDQTYSKLILMDMYNVYHI